MAILCILSWSTSFKVQNVNKEEDQLQSGRSQSFQSQYGRVWVRKISIWQKVHIAMYAIIVSCKITGVGNIREPSGGCSIQDQQLGIDLCNYITL